MRVLLVTHGLAPEHLGGTEASVLGLARALLGAGLEVAVVAGSDRWDLGPATRGERLDLDEGPLRVLRLQRTDAHYDHWHKHRRASVRERFEALLRTERPDLVHVHHWIRLSRDLVASAASCGIPAIVTLHDLASTCLLVHRVHPGDRGPCDRSLSPEACIPCAESHARPTPWMSSEDQRDALAEFRRWTGTELRLARAVIALSPSQLTLLTRQLPDLATEDWHVLPPFAEGPPLERALRPPPRPGSLRLGSWGSVSSLKGQDLIVRAAALAARHVHVELDLAGAVESPALLEACRTEARAAGVPLRFHGRFEREGLHLHPVAAADVFVSGTRARETWGVVLDEALQLGLPLVLPRHGAYADRLSDGAGVRFYEPLEPEDLARVLVELARDPWGLARLAEAVDPRSAAAGAHRSTLRKHLEIYDAAVRAGAPEPEPLSASERARQRAAEEAWDHGLHDRGP